MTHTPAMLTPGLPSAAGLDSRSALILRELVETYVATGEPVGSRTLSRRLPLGLSPATIRNAMADLEDAGLLYAPHTSAGRLPTERGLRLFVDGLLEFGALGEDDRDAIAARCAASGRSLQETLAEAGLMLSGLAGAAGLVVAPKTENPVRHIEFVALGPGRALVVLVHEGGQVENRVIEVPAGLPPSAFCSATGRLVAAGSQPAARAVDIAVATSAEVSRPERNVAQSGVGGAGGSSISSHACCQVPSTSTGVISCARWVAGSCSG